MADAVKTGNVVGSVPRRRGVKAGIYLLPNMITATSLFCGFLAIKTAMDARLMATPELALQAFVQAAYLILIAGVCDGLDGSVARLTRTQSAFGVQFDSLCDLVSFGVAPAMVAYQFVLHGVGRPGLAAAFIFATAGALRLARFNVQSSVGKASGNFSGIPIPMAAAPVAVYILAHQSLQEWMASSDAAAWQKNVASVLTNPLVNGWTLFGIMLMLALGMISTFEYVSTKSMKLPRKHPFRFFAGLLMGIVLLFSLDFTITLAVLLLVYCVHGPVLWLFFKKHRGDEEEELFSSPDEDEEETP